MGGAVLSTRVFGSKRRVFAALVRSFVPGHVRNVRVWGRTASRSRGFGSCRIIAGGFHPGGASDALVLGSVPAAANGQGRSRPLARLSRTETRDVVWRNLLDLSPGLLDASASARSVYELVRPHRNIDRQQLFHRPELST